MDRYFTQLSKILTHDFTLFIHDLYFVTLRKDLPEQSFPTRFTIC